MDLTLPLLAITDDGAKFLAAGMVMGMGPSGLRWPSAT
jgi:hypothetical protein